MLRKTIIVAILQILGIVGAVGYVFQLSAYRHVAPSTRTIEGHRLSFIACWPLIGSSRTVTTRLFLAFYQDVSINLSAET